MYRNLIALTLLAFAASTFALDLSHASPLQVTQLQPQALDFLTEFFKKVVYPKIEEIAKTFTTLGGQLFATYIKNAARNSDGRSVMPSEAEMRGFWDNLWNNALRPPIENALTSVSLLAAQALAGIGVNGIDLSIGKRDLTTEDARIIDALNQAFNTVFNQVIKNPLENAISTGSLLLAQVLAGIGTNGVDLSSLFGTVGKRDLSVEEEARIIDALNQALNTVFNQVIKNPLENAISTGSLLLAQVLAGIGTNGVDLSSLFGTVGKRDVTADMEGRGAIIDNLRDHATGLLITQVKPALESALSAAALQLAGVLAGIADLGIGRR